ncbi:MAG: tetraacyldisaccharide 4'-kinase, partial [Bacteroidales bacterium]|nr:tetraacyldisaccharide 4'-kinase [Bacteroidales bacterium]
MDKRLIARKIFAWLLFPLTIWYAIGVAMRNLLFFIGILKERTHRVTTIGVGNLCVGGAGKTPHVDYLLKKLKNDYRVATLSRG